MQTDQLPIE